MIKRLMEDGFMSHTEKYFRNLIKSNRNQIVFTMHPLIWNQTDVCLVPDQSENDKYNLILVCFNNISARFPCDWQRFGHNNN